MDDPGAAVAGVRSLDQARELHGQIERDLERDHMGMGFEEIEAHEQALRDLQEMFKTLDRETKQKRERIGNAEDRASDRQDKKKARAKEKRARGRRATRQRATGRARGRIRRESSWAWRQTGIPGATRSATELTLQAVGAFVGLTFAYLLLTHPKTVEGALRGLRTGVKVLIDPVDPLARATRTSIVKGAIEAAGLDYLPAVEEPLVPLTRLGGRGSRRLHRDASAAIAEAGKALQRAGGAR